MKPNTEVKSWLNKAKEDLILHNTISREINLRPQRFLLNRQQKRD